MQVNLFQVEFYLIFIQICRNKTFLLGRALSAKRTLLNENMPIQQGDFLSSATQMEVRVKIAKSLLPSITHQLVDNRHLSTRNVNIL